MLLEFWKQLAALKNKIVHVIHCFRRNKKIYMINFIKSYNFWSLIQRLTCFKNPQNLSCTGLVLTYLPHPFQYICIHSVLLPKTQGILILESLNHQGTGFFHHMGDMSIWGDISDNGNQRRGHNSGQQLSYTTSPLSRKKIGKSNFPRKNSFNFDIICFKRTYINCSLANFKRVASSHEKLHNKKWRIFDFSYFLLRFLNNTSLNNSLSNFKRTVSTQTEAAIESCSGKSVSWNVLKTTGNRLKSRQNPWKIHVKGLSLRNTCERVHF